MHVSPEEDDVVKIRKMFGHQLWPRAVCLKVSQGGLRNDEKELKEAETQGIAK